MNSNGDPHYPTRVSEKTFLPIHERSVVTTYSMRLHELVDYYHKCLTIAPVEFDGITIEPQGDRILIKTPKGEVIVQVKDDELLIDGRRMGKHVDHTRKYSVNELLEQLGCSYVEADDLRTVLVEYAIVLEKALAASTGTEISDQNRRNNAFLQGQWEQREQSKGGEISRIQQEAMSMISKLRI